MSESGESTEHLEVSEDNEDSEDTVVAAEAYPVVEQPSATAAEPEPTAARTRPITRVLLALLAVWVVLAALTCWLYFGMYRADRQLGAEAEQAAMAAAADGSVAVLTYSPKTLQSDFDAAKRYLTGEFLSYYTEFTENVVTPAAKQKEVQTVATVVRKGIVSLRPVRAEVLVFINQTTISKSNPDGSFSMSSVKVGLEMHDGRWLISSFDPV